MLLKRTNLNNVHEVEDFRAAVSFLQGEPGVDPERIGIWGSSNGGSVVIAVAAADARVKAVVSQVAAPRPAPRGAGADGAPTASTMRSSACGGAGRRSRRRLLVPQQDRQWGTQRNRDVRAGAMLDQIPPDDAVLFLPAEKDELTQGAGRRDRRGKVPHRARRARRRRSSCPG